MKDTIKQLKAFNLQEHVYAILLHLTDCVKETSKIFEIIHS